MEVWQVDRGTYSTVAQSASLGPTEVETRDSLTRRVDEAVDGFEVVEGMQECCTEVEKVWGSLRRSLLARLTLFRQLSSCRSKVEHTRENERASSARNATGAMKFAIDELAVRRR